MGNNLTGLSPNQSVSVEQVLTEWENWKHEKILGSSRFFKVSKIRLKKEGKSGVLKVFKYPDGTKTIVDRYLNLMQSYCTTNPNITNVLAYSRCFINKDVAYLLRDHVHYSLNERISTRPFLTIEEKKWIAFQILCGLTQCHKERLVQHYQDSPNYIGIENKLCHGDLKTENIMLTDWGWVFLTDMAPFKPVYLPANNPSEFYFFFDVSGKRACYLAPERFVDMVNTQKGTSDLSGAKSTSSKKTDSSDMDTSNEALKNQVSIDMTDPFKNVIQPSMDMFSTGCIFIELFTDGIVPFNLAELFNYRVNEDTKLNSLLLKIRDKNIQNMIRGLLQISPHERITAEECLVSQRGLSFPDVFYRDLKSYMAQFLQESFSRPDNKINKLYNEFPELMRTYLVNPKARSTKNGNLILFVNLITSAIFSVEEEQSKINCLVMLKELGLHMIDELVLDRIVPFLLEFIDADHSIEVRRTALDCLVLSVASVNPSSPADISFFPDYLLPAICDMQNDSSVTIRHTFSRHIPCLAKAAHRFLKKCVILQKITKKVKETIDYNSELAHLRELFRETIIQLFSEQDVLIKCCITHPQYLGNLAEFFSIGQAIEILLSHLITFLNDKTNYLVRCAFYRCVPDLINIMGVQSLRLLHSLLVQGLQDSHLQVVEICCHSLAKMIRTKLMPHWLNSQLFPNVVALLGLPYNSIRLTALDYVISFTIHSPCSTVYSCFLKCDERNCIFKTKDLMYIQNHMESTLWANLMEPISRAIFEDIIRSSAADDFLVLLNDRQDSMHDNLSGRDEAVENMLKKLQEMGMTINNESQILLLRRLITEIVISKRSIKNTLPNNVRFNQNVAPFNTNIQYFTYKSANQSHIPLHPVPEAMSSIDFEASLDKDISEILYGGTESRISSQRPSKDVISDNTWENLFDSGPTEAPRSNRPIELKVLTGFEDCSVSDVLQSDILEGSLKRLDTDKFRLSVHRGLSTGTHYVKTDRHSKINNNYLPTAWKPKGILVGHLHEHRRGYTSILAHPIDKQMISSGADKTVKFWNCDPNPGKADPTCSKYIPNKSSQSLQLVNDDNPKNSPYDCCQKLVWTENYNSVAVVVDRKYTHIIDRNGDKKKTLDFPIDKYGYISNLETPIESGCELDVASERTLIYSTTGNWIVAHDTRCPSPIGSIWAHKQNNDFGYITCLAIHSSYTWMVTGTSRGSLICWDLRFQSVVNNITHSNMSGFLSLKLNPLTNDPSGNRNSQVWAATEEANEISSWNLESKCPITTLKTSIPQLSNPASNDLQSIKRQASVNSLQSNNYSSKAFAAKLIGTIEQRPCILSGSSDCHLRFWDLADPMQSTILSVGGLDQYCSDVSSSYNLSINDSDTVIIDEQQKVHYTDENLTQKRNFQPFTGHVSNICDVTTVSLGQQFLVSSSMDGVIKLWK